jgi:hypothetical protein
MHRRAHGLQAATAIGIATLAVTGLAGLGPAAAASGGSTPAGNASRPGPLTGMFDFRRQRPAPKVFLDPDTGEPTSGRSQ